ncbi:MAG: restriction endonuclease subunit S, partial [Anaerolineaceae bacterium]|nr:restriction endonuclease subunit S [Anaerolineaceae bacterium]
RENDVAVLSFPLRPIKEVTLEVRAGFASGKARSDIMGVPHVRPMNINEDGRFVFEGMKFISEDEFKGREDYALDAGDVLFNNTNSIELVGKTCIIESSLRGGFSNHMTRIRVNQDICLPNFLALVLHFEWRKGKFTQLATRWVGQAGINTSNLADFEIPLPPLEVQREIVAEIEGYQKVIDGARAVVNNYRPHIPIHPDWPMVEVGKACIVNPKKSEVSDLDDRTEVSFVPMSDIGENVMFIYPRETKRLNEVAASYTYFKDGDVLIAKVTPCFENGKAGIARDLRNGIGFGSSELYVLRPTKAVLPEWLFMCVAIPAFRAYAIPQMTGTGGLQRVPKDVVESFKIPLPPPATQQAIVAEIEAEQALVKANRELIARFEKKIQAALARVWGEEEPVPAEA